MPKYRVKRHLVTQPEDQSIRLIPLTQGLNAVVDVRDFDWLSQWNWNAWWNPNTHSFYAVRAQGTKRMHQEILGCVSRNGVDHINHDTLLNIRSNLRKATPAENSQNRRLTISNKSGYKGVSFRNDENRWQAQITASGHLIHLGRFDSAESAARAYDAAAKELHGEFAILNFPPTCKID